MKQYRIFRSPLNRAKYFVCEVDEEENPIVQVTEELEYEEAAEFCNN